MKISMPKDNFMSSKAELLPLVPESEIDILDSSNSVRYDLKTSPADAASPTYRKTIRILTGSESIRTIIKWTQDLEIVLTGLAIPTTNAGCIAHIAIIRSVMSGTPQALFDTAIDLAMTHGRETAAQAADDAAELIAAGSGAAARALVMATHFPSKTINKKQLKIQY